MYVYTYIYICINMVCAPQIDLTGCSTDVDTVALIGALVRKNRLAENGRRHKSQKVSSTITFYSKLGSKPTFQNFCSSRRIVSSKMNLRYFVDSEETHSRSYISTHYQKILNSEKFLKFFSVVSSIGG